MASVVMQANPFEMLIPRQAARMPVAWHHLRIPGPPEGFELSKREIDAPEPMQRFYRRTIQLLDCGVGGQGDCLALVDKASPHALFDLMLSETSVPDKPSPVDVSALTGLVLSRSGLEFVRFVSDPAHQRAFGLENGQLHLALNCDPNTGDRESVQAAKQFHLHLLYWTAGELKMLGQPGRLQQETDPRTRRQLLDPLSFLGARIISEAIRGLPLGIPGAEFLDYDEGAVCAGRRPLGCLIRLPGWAVLETPQFVDLVRRLHNRLASLGEALLFAFTGERRAPSAWHRHRLLPTPNIGERLAEGNWSEAVAAGLAGLASDLRDLTPGQAARLRRAPSAARKHCMTLNQPCYGVNLHAPMRNTPGEQLVAADEVWMIIQTKLFSGTGGAGLLALDGIPSVRVLRGQGSFSPRQWQRRSAFQRDFALYNSARSTEWPGVGCSPVRRLVDFRRGWC